MYEARISCEVSNLLHRLYLWPKKFPDVEGAGLYPKPGFPDIVCLRGHTVIEVKAMRGKDWEHQVFPFKNLSAPQRTWMEMWLWDNQDDQDDWLAPTAYLALGTTLGHAGAKNKPRMLWLIPWRYWLHIESTLLPYRASLPLTAFSGQKPKEVQNQQLKAMMLLSHWALELHDSKWHVPEHHPLRRPMIRERDTAAFLRQWHQTTEAIDEYYQHLGR